MKKYIFLLATLFVLKLTSQNKQILYDFANLPQTLLLNPAQEMPNKFHIGIPLFSGVSAELGISGFTLRDIFGVDDININDKVSSVLNNISSNDFVKSHFQLEVLNIGFKLDEKNYLSFGFYEEVDIISYFPDDVLTLFTFGNARSRDRIYTASHIRYKLDGLGVLHAGISRKINDKFSIGGRLKIYSSSFNLESINNSGVFTTVPGENNIYEQFLNNVDINFRNSGLIENEENKISAKAILENSFFGKNSNLGIGIDLGFSYDMSKKLKLSASVLDIGFINYTKNIQNTKAQGEFAFDGINFQYNPDSTINYWDQLRTRFEEQLPITQDNSSYISWRPTKVNLALKYSFGEGKRLLCYDEVYKDYFLNSFGFQFYSVFRRLSTQMAFTAFYEKPLSKNFKTKFTYTVDDFSSSNIGVGISTQLNKFNFYAMVDNILEFSNLSSANNISLQFGFNLIFK